MLIVHCVQIYSVSLRLCEPLAEIFMRYGIQPLHSGKVV